MTNDDPEFTRMVESLVAHRTAALIRGNEALREEVSRYRSENEELTRQLAEAKLASRADRELPRAALNLMEDALRARRAAQDSEERFRTLVAQVKDYAIFRADRQGRATSWNEGVRCVLGFEENEFIGVDLSRVIFTPEDIQAGVPEMELETAAREGRASNDRWMRRKDGTRFFAGGVTTALRGPAGELMGFTKVMRDLTRERVHEQRLAEQARLLDLSNDAIIVRALDDRIVYWNQGAEEIYGWSGAEAAGRNLYELLHVEFPEPLERIIEKLHREGRWMGESTQRRRDGTRIAVATRWALDRDAQGQPASILQTDNDITARKNAEEAVRRRTAQFETLLNEAPLGVFLVDLAFRIRDVNPAALAMLGNPPNLVGSELSVVIQLLWPDQEPGPVLEQFRRTLERGERYVAPERIDNRQDLARGITRYYEWQINRIELPEGGRGVVCYFHDVSRQVIARAAIAESEAKFRTIADTLPQMIWTARPDGQIDFYNERWYEFTGFPRGDFTESQWERILHPEDVERCREAYQRSIREGVPFETEYRFKDRARGGYRWFMGRALPVRNEAGEILKWFGTCTDIDDQKRAEARLEEVVAERTAKLHDTINELESFSYSIAHDMRAPLRSLQGFARILLLEYSGAVDAEGQDYLQRIANSASRMDDLIRDVLYFSRITRSELPLVEVDVDDLLRGILSTYPNLAPDQAEITIEGVLPPVISNRAMLTQVFSNLLGNAVKFVKPGSKARVTIWAEPGRDTVRFLVRDEGIGIPEQDFESIFGIFQQLNRQYDGTGIGLAIVRKAVERMGGKVGVKSRVGQGSTFWVELKAASSSPPSQPSQPREAPRRGGHDDDAASIRPND